MLNATLFGEMITFGIFAWVTMRFIMPPVNAALQAREDEIAAGLRAAEQGQSALDAAQGEATEMIASAKQQVRVLLNSADQRAEKLIEEGKAKGQVEKQRLVQAAQGDIAQQAQVARQALQQEVAQLVLVALERVLGEQINAKVNEQLLENLIVKAED